MICLEKLQKELCRLLDIDQATLPSVQEILKKEGYTGIQKGEEFIDLTAPNTTKQTPEAGEKTTPESSPESSAYVFTDSKGVQREIPPEVAQKWCETFGLKSINDEFVAQLQTELADKEIKINKNHLESLVENGGEKYIPQMKEVLAKSRNIFIADNTTIFAQGIENNGWFVEIGKKDYKDFLSVTFKPIPKPEKLPEKTTTQDATQKIAEKTLFDLSDDLAIRDIVFTDKKGKEHMLTEQVQRQWLETFNLNNLDESYIPKHSDEIKQALGGKEIKIQLGSLKKLVAQGREQYIPQIKEVLDTPEAIIIDDMGEYLFIKHLKNDDYFVNVSFDNGEFLVSISNGIKETRNLNNKLQNGGRFIYQSPNFNSISQKLLQTSQYSANRIDEVDSTTKLPKQAQDLSSEIAPYQNQSRAEILQAQEGFKNNFLKAAESIMQNKFITKASYAKFKNLKLDEFFDDFRIKGMRDLGKSYRDGNNYVRLIDGQLENGNTFRIYQYDPSFQRVNEFINTMVLEIFTPNDKLAKKLTLQTYTQNIKDYKDEIVNTILHNVEFTIHDGKKQKNLKYITNTRSASYEVTQSELTGEKKPLLGYGEWDEFMKLEGSGGVRFYDGVAIIDTRSGDEYTGYTQTWQVQGKDFNTLKEAKEYIKAIKEPFTKAEEKELADIYKEFEIEQDAWSRGGNYTIDPENRYSDVLHGKLELQEFKKPKSAYELQREKYIFLNELVKKHHNPYGIAFKLTGDFANPVEFLTTVKLGYVENAFYKEGLGSIDLVWGEVSGKGQDAEGYGLAKILEKHLHDFTDFAGDSAESKAANAISEIIQKGAVIKQGNRATLRYEKDGKVFKVGLKQNWHGKPTENKWVITAYKDDRETAKSIDTSDFTKDETLPLNSGADSIQNLAKEQDTDRIYKEAKQAQDELIAEPPAEMKTLFDFIQEPQVKETKTKITTTTIKDDIKTTTTIDKTTGEHTTHKEVRNLNLPKTRAETQQTKEQKPKNPQENTRENLQEASSKKTFNIPDKEQQEALLRNAKASPYPQNADEAVKTEPSSSPSLEQGNPPQSHLNDFDSTTTTQTTTQEAKNYHWSAREEVRDTTTRIEANINALRIAKDLANSGRAATPAEQEALAKFSGFGGLTGAFKEGSTSLKSLKEILDANELASLRQTILDAYYTPEHVIKLIYDTIGDKLPKNANVLEPSMGVGRFIGLGKDSYNYTGVELDKLTYTIAQALFPNAKIANEDYMRVPFSHNQFDLVIGNPPYGETKLKYKDMHGLNIHSAFMLKNIDLARENGIIAQVVSTSFLDSQTPAAYNARHEILKRARVIGAMRLPSDSFSGTSISTDILILQKRNKPLESFEKLGEIDRYIIAIPTNQFKSGDQWLYENRVFGVLSSDNENDLFSFVKLAQDAKVETGNYGTARLRYEKLEDAEEEQEFIELWAKSVKNRLEKVTPSTKTIDNLKDLEQYQREFKKRQIGQIKLYGDRVGQIELTQAPNGDKAITERMMSVEEFALGDSFAEYEKLKSTKTLKGIQKAKLTRHNKKINIAKTFLDRYENLLNALTTLRKSELNPENSEAEIAKARSRLNFIYDETIEALRKISPKTPYLTTNRELKSMFAGDINYTQLQGLEKPLFDKQGEIIEGIVEKADIFTKRINNPTFTPTQANSLEQAIQYSNQYKGGLDFYYMGQILSRDSHEIRNEMIQSGKLFVDDKGVDIDLHTLLSGNVREKLTNLKNIAQNSDDDLLAKTIEKLEEHQPEDVPFNKIVWDISSGFIPEQVFWEWGSIVNISKTKDGRYYSDDYKITYTPNTSSARAVLNKDVFNAATGIAKRHFEDPHDTIKFDMAIKKLKKDFESFVLSDEKMIKAIEKSYNEKINIYARNFDPQEIMEVDSNFIFPNANPNINLYPTQIRAVFRAVHDKNNTLFNHEVGAGKTFTLITTAMELRRIGKAKKPLISVPNHLVPQFTLEALRLYPNARILPIQNLGAKNFKQAQAQMLYNDFDIVLVGHSVLDAMEMPISYQKEFFQNLVYEKREAAKTLDEGSLSLRKVEQDIKNINSKIHDLISKKDSSKIILDFDEMGIDALLVDEAHMYKNLGFHTGYEFKQLGSQQSRAKTDNMLMKTNYLNANGKKIIFATGTPMANSLIEIHHMLNYLHPKGLEEMGIKNMDNFISNFIRSERVMETKADGTRDFVDTAIGTKNNKTLMKLVNQIFDTIDFEQVQAQAKAVGKEIVRPDIKNTSVVVEKYDDIQHLYNTLIIAQSKFLKEQRHKALEQGINDLSIFTDAKKLSVDPRLVDWRLIEKYEKTPELNHKTKLYHCAQNIIKKQEEWSDRKTAQIVFCDLKESKFSSINTHRQLKKYLLEASNEQGEKYFKPNEIVVIDDIKKENYAKLYDQINKAEVKVLITTTEKTGTGANIQEKLVAMHHLDAPYRPADFEQRIGRMLRQGNEYAMEYHVAKQKGDTSVRPFYAENFTYVTKDTLDSRIFEILENKSRAFRDFYKGGEVDFEIDLKELMDYDFIKAEASGNKNELEFYKVSNELKNLETQKQIQLEEFMKKPQIIAEIQTQIKKIQGDLDNLNAFKESAKSNSVEVMGRVVEFDFAKSHNKPSTLSFDDLGEKAKLQDLRDFMNKNKKELLAPFSDGKQNAIRLYTYGGADLIAIRDFGDELGFCFDIGGQRMFIDSRRKLESFNPSDSLNFIKILQNKTKTIAEKNKELVALRVKMKNLENIKAEFEHQDQINALEYYREALAKAIENNIREPIAKPAEVAKFFSFGGVGLGLFGAIYSQEGDFWEFRG